MKTVVRKLYEGLFLVDSALAASDWEGVNNAMKTVLDRAGAEIVSMSKWDERKLAYEINKKGRGTYILCYFKVEGPKIKNIERDVQLSEMIMRTMILNAEHMSQEDIAKETPAMMAARQEQERADRVEAAAAEAEAEKAKEQEEEQQEEASSDIDEPEEGSVEESSEDESQEPGEEEVEAEEVEAENELEKD